ncbi:MAG: hypothetical protein H0W13_04055 [Nitrospirales bacterium]|nr:hypothetical protein [Nitrospirales bacterium]
MLINLSQDYFMNTCYSGRSSRPAELFSFGLLDGPPWITVSRTGPLTISRASTHVTLYSSRRAPCEKPTGRGASWRAWDGRVQWALRSQPLRDGIPE